MTRRLNLVVLALSLICAFYPAHSGHAASAQRVTVEARVRAEVEKDLAPPYRPGEGLEERTCLDGRPVKGFQDEIAELWANLECPYCGIQEPVLAQRQNADLCIVVRHIPTQEYGESLKKALSYEALKKFSVNAANLFWDAVVPKNSLPMPVPYEGALLRVFQEAALAPEAFGEALTRDAADIVNQDIAAAQYRIFSTPTWVLAGIRFSACDFTAAQLPPALELAKKTRAGDNEAKERIITIITNGHMNEKML
ncbi:MAG: hypothetical protein LBB60_06470 [Desulfovibrio sp.]|jgi:hypothetical protein|nr:hypothetical protein [Desulfovibrio sp.]